MASVSDNSGHRWCWMISSTSVQSRLLLCFGMRLSLLSLFLSSAELGCVVRRCFCVELAVLPRCRLRDVDMSHLFTHHKNTPPLQIQFRDVRSRWCGVDKLSCTWCHWCGLADCQTMLISMLISNHASTVRTNDASDDLTYSSIDDLTMTNRQTHWRVTVYLLK